ncbi:MAG: Gfo/Idh/MocA family oxidoreductase [Herpetosiphonaceae bacterium]|nr:Gfo/Idh/MocA family oxidoreductase [Herpetosiphonaceae bacterium]
MTNLRFAIFGTGFWSRFQLAAWTEISGADCVALFNRTRAKAQTLAAEFNIRAVYNDPEELLRREQLDFIDIITDVDTHSAFVALAAEYKVPVICQKPMAPTLALAEQMVMACRAGRVPFFVHENWRWQTPIRQLKQIVASGVIGVPFRARIAMITGFPVFVNQPFLKELDQFILTDLGSHILDVARLFFGEAESVACQTQRIHRDIKGEDVATVLLNMDGKMTVICEMAYAETPLEHDRFPQTTIFIEGDRGSAELSLDYWIRVTNEDGTHARRYPPPHYSWADPDYDLVHASIVPCNANLLGALRGTGMAETSGDDNLRTVRLVHAAYRSAASGETIRL